MGLEKGKGADPAGSESSMPMNQMQSSREQESQAQQYGPRPGLQQDPIIAPVLQPAVSTFCAPQ